MTDKEWEDFQEFLAIALEPRSLKLLLKVAIVAVICDFIIQKKK
jgi:hypothetical protein